MQSSDKLQIIDQDTFMQIVNENKHYVATSITTTTTPTPNKVLKSQASKKGDVRARLTLGRFFPPATNQCTISNAKSLTQTLHKAIAHPCKASAHAKRLSTLKKRVVSWRSRTQKCNLVGSRIIEELDLAGLELTGHTEGDESLKENESEPEMLETVCNNDSTANSCHFAITPANSIHSRRFREYCDNTTNEALIQHTKYLLTELQRFQFRAHKTNAIRAHSRRRYVLGFREVLNMLLTSRVKLVIVATDCEFCPMSGGLNEKINKIKQLCHAKCLPLAFVLNRRQLGYLLNVKGLVSCIAVLNDSGAQEHFDALLLELERAKEQYMDLMSQ